MPKQGDVVYLRWDMHADSWSGTRTLLSVHGTLEAAKAAVPENIKSATYHREPFGTYVENYTYEAIEAVTLT